jgi:hypothetical protein
MIQTLEEWESFDAFSLNFSTSGNSIVTVGMHFLPLVKFPSPIDPVRFQAFLLDLQRVYIDMPYHNQIHAADVAQAAMWLIKGEPDFTENSGIFLMATLAHDCGHFARTNAFLRASGNSLAARLGEESTLEKYHLEISTKIIKEHEIFPEHVFQESIEPLFRELVLATDSSHMCDPSDKNSLLIKAADVSALARNFQRGLLWGKRLSQEFADQREEEERLGMDMSMLPSSSRDFAREYVVQIYKDLARVIPKVDRVVQILVNALKD